MNRYLQKWNDIVESVIPKKTAKDLKKIKTLAVFDFDKTLFKKDSFLSLYKFIVIKYPIRFIYLPSGYKMH